MLALPLLLGACLLLLFQRFSLPGVDFIPRTDFTMTLWTTSGTAFEALQQAVGTLIVARVIDQEGLLGGELGRFSRSRFRRLFCLFPVPYALIARTALAEIAMDWTVRPRNTLLRQRVD